ncbi:MAG: FAD-binding protein [Nitriliruptorales bacterium]|nr:FAD-binding protein [Nitriliruptorales bacterium]
MTSVTPTHRPRTELEAALSTALQGEVRFDAYTRHLYSTDASSYAIEPIGVVCPRDADDVAAAIAVATEFEVPVLPRGGGTSLAGQTVGEAVVLDFSRHMSRVLALEPEARTARVQPGLVQDDLNRAAAAHGLAFGADTSTSSRATLGGMIGNNSCGSQSVIYGSTASHIRALDVILSDTTRARLSAVDGDEATRRGRADTLEGRLYRDIPALVERHRQDIADRYPAFWRRNSGYALDRLLDRPLDLAQLVVGSEGTLAAVVEAEVGLVPLPEVRVIAVGHFHSTGQAIAATEDALAFQPAQVELMDRTILDLAKSKHEFAELSTVLDGDPSALLFVTFYADSEVEATASLDGLLARWRQHGHGYAVVRAVTAAQQRPLLKVRKSGLGLLMAASRGAERPLAFVEDTAVDPRHLAEYSERFREILDRHKLRAGFYGHASVGCLHVRPFIDLTRPGGAAVMRAVAEEIRDLVASYGGANSSEHGDGLARSEFNRGLFGDELYGALRAVKGLFDPDNRMNPGKIVDAPAMTEHLRDPALPPPQPLRTHLAFADQPSADGAMRAAADRCMRIGACRKTGDGVMCPSYMATKEEEHSTRGRAMALVKALSEPDPRTALGDERLHEILDLCLECKACKSECPMSVDMAALKSETLAHYHDLHGTPLRARIFAGVRRLSRLGSALAPLSNAAGGLGPARALLERVSGIDRRRPLPRFERVTLSRWFARRPAPQGPFPRGDLVFLADSFTSFSEPAIGRAAIELLELAGWRVRLEDRGCCGRPAISKGLLDDARRAAHTMVGRLAAEAERGVPIVGCEPSCVLTLDDEHPSLLPGDPRAKAVGAQARLIDEVLLEALDDGGLELDPDSAVSGRRILYHGHCNQKALRGTAATLALLERIPGAQVVEVDAGCCGMAGSFGFEREHYDLSLQIGGQRLFPAVRAEPPGTLLSATGVSCRQQIAHGTGRSARHPVELLRAALR